MATQTSLVAQQVRLKQWAEQIRECQNRPEGMDVKTWCTQNNITKTSYYYRLRRVREACLEQIQNTDPVFVELPAPDNHAATPANVPAPGIPVDQTPVIRIKNIRRLSDEIENLKDNGTDSELSSDLKLALITYFTNIQTLITQMVFSTPEHIGDTLINNAQAVLSALKSGWSPEQPESGIVQIGSVLSITNGVIATQTGTVLDIA